MRDGKEAILKMNGRVSGILLGWDNSTHQVSPLFPALVPKPLKNQFCLAEIPVCIKNRGLVRSNPHSKNVANP